MITVYYEQNSSAGNIPDVRRVDTSGFDTVDDAKNFILQRCLESSVIAEKHHIFEEQEFSFPPYPNNKL